MAAPPEKINMEGKRVCPACFKFVLGKAGEEPKQRHPHCEKKEDAEIGRGVKFIGDMAIPAAPPFKQCVFDIETMGLDRTWGVLLMATCLTYGPGEPELHTFSLRDTDAFKAGRRGDDRDIFLQLYTVLEQSAIWFAHNGLFFDVRWVNSLCLAYGLAPLKRKLVDPVQLSRKNFALGSNALGSMLDFTGAEHQKMPLGPSVWRGALLNDEDAAWELLRQRNISDVLALAELAVKVSPFVGTVDLYGSANR
jgi:hypothetical protein